MWANHLEDTVGVSQTVLPLKLAASVATLTAQADWHCLANIGAMGLCDLIDHELCGPGRHRSRLRFGAFSFSSRA